MSITNTIIQWNPTGGNQESDAAYAADTQRSGGALAGQDLFYNTANKLWYQTSSMVAALAQALANKGIATDGSNFDDASFANLVTAMSGIVTGRDIQVSGSSSSWALGIPYGFPFSPNPILIQGGKISQLGNGTPVTYPFYPVFQSLVFGMVISLGSEFVGSTQCPITVGAEPNSGTPLTNFDATVYTAADPASHYGCQWIAVGI